MKFRWVILASSALLAAAGPINPYQVVIGTTAGTLAAGNDSRFSAPTITGGSINGTPIGSSAPSTGSFSTLNATGGGTLANETLTSPTINSSTINSSTITNMTENNTGQMYQNNGAHIFRYGDRAFIGAASDNPANSNRSQTPTDWLTALMQSTPIGGYPVYGAQTASLSRYGAIGLLGASQASDSQAQSGLLGYTPAAIGVAAWGINDDTTTGSTAVSAWGFYGEGWAKGSSYRPAFAAEFEADRFGTLPTGTTNPYATNVGGGAYGLQIGSGGGQSSGTVDAQGAIVVVSNPNAYQTGLTFGSTAITGTNGNDNGYGEAIGLAKNQAIAWHTPETTGGVTGGTTGALIRSTVTLGADASRMEFQNAGVVFSNASGLQIFSISNSSGPTNTLQIQSGASTQAAGIYVIEGSGGSANLGLYPASGGELILSSSVTPTSTTAALIPAYGFMHINVNGTEMRIPLFSPTQAGG